MYAMDNFLNLDLGFNFAVQKPGMADFQRDE
jgi:hypothetical protein